MLRPAHPSDRETLHRLTTSLATYGFLTLPSSQNELEDLIDCSQKSFLQKLSDPQDGQFLFVLEKDSDKKREVIGSSLIIGRHGSPQSPHLYFQIDPLKKTLQLKAEATGRTELGGLILDPKFRGHPEKLGKCLSLIRLLYIETHPHFFYQNILAEFLPPLSPKKDPPLWEALGQRFTGLSYREADRLARTNKTFILQHFPKEEIPIDSLPLEAQKMIGVVGADTQTAVRILSSVGFRYLNQIDPFDGGPHYGVSLKEMKRDIVHSFFRSKISIRWEIS